MPNEHLASPAESGERSKAELEAARAEQLDKLHLENAEKAAGPEHAEKRAEHARKVIDRQEPEPAVATEETAHKPAGTIRIPFINHHLNYVQTMAAVQRQLSPVSRSFSKFIHAPAVEKASEALESTVARPSVIAGTIWTALIVGTIFYLTAHHYGYALSGSELLFSFIVGALLGLVLEGLWHIFKRRPQ